MPLSSPGVITYLPAFEKGSSEELLGFCQTYILGTFK